MENQANSQPEKGFVAGFLKFLPAVQWFLMIIIAVAVFALSQRDSQTAQAQGTLDNTRRIISLEKADERQEQEVDRKFEQLRREMLTREVFEAYHKGDAERMDRLEKMLEQNLSR